MAEHANVLQGPTVPVRWNGETYQLGMLDQDGKGFYEQWCREAAYEEVLRCEGMVQRGLMRPEHYARMHDRYDDHVMGRAFDWGGAMWQTFFDTKPGRVQLFYLAISRRHRDFQPEEARALFDSLPPKKASELSLYIVNGPPADPNAPAAAAPQPAAA